MIKQHMLFFDSGVDRQLVQVSQEQDADGATLSNDPKGIAEAVAPTADSKRVAANDWDGAILVGVYKPFVMKILEAFWPLAEKQAERLQQHWDSFSAEPQEEALREVVGNLPEAPEIRLKGSILGLCEWLLAARQAQCMGDSNARLFLYVGPENRKSKKGRRQLRDPETEAIYSYVVEQRHEPSILGALPMPVYLDKEEADGEGELTPEEQTEKTPDMKDILVLEFQPEEWLLLRSVGLTFGFPFHKMENWLAEIFKLLQGLATVAQGWNGPPIKMGLISQGDLENVTPRFFRAWVPSNA